MTKLWLDAIITTVIFMGACYYIAHGGLMGVSLGILSWIFHSDNSSTSESDGQTDGW